MTRRLSSRAVLISFAVLVLLLVLTSLDFSRTSPPPFRRSHVVVASAYGAHCGVYLAFVWTLQEVLGAQSQVRVYSPQPFPYGFTNIVDRLKLYNGRYTHIKNLIDDVNSTSLYADEPGAVVDLIILGDCEIDMPRWSNQLLEIFDARPEGRGFELVCIAHNIEDVTWQGHITPWARRGAIRLLSISEQVAVSFRTKFATLADSADPEIYGSGYEYIPVDVHVPVLPLPEIQEKSPSAVLSNAVLQGRFERDYDDVFADLRQSLEENPFVWGYKALPNASAGYEPDPSAILPPFVLHLVDHDGIEIPQGLTGIVRTYTQLQYSYFYGMMRQMDIFIPPFPSNSGSFNLHASSAMAMAVECNVPILVTNRIRAVYTYIADDRIVVTRPQALHEIHAIRTLRTGNPLPPSSLGGDAARKLELAAGRMLERGWHRSNRGFAEVKSQIWRANADVARLILNDRVHHGP